LIYRTTLALFFLALFLTVVFVATPIAHADEMIAIPSGSIQIGSDGSQPGPHTTIKAFKLAKHPVMRSEFAQFIEETNYDAGKGWRKPRFAQNDTHPVVNVSWNDAQAYIDWLNKKSGQRYRLPTEAEWEYAARAGTKTAYYWGDDIGKANATCNDCGNAWDGDSTSPVGTFAANPWGLFDMSGNVAQWMQDCFVESSANTPPASSAGECKSRVIRGGSWSDSPRALRIDTRDGNLADFRYMSVGFRLAQDF
jgi:formylglycine-generating enzyme required for sulfatase activity